MKALYSRSTSVIHLIIWLRIYFNMAPFANYLSALVQRRDLVYKITTGVYGFPISKEDGYLSITKTMKYAIVQHTGEERYECSCETDYLYDSSVESCIHVKASKQLYQRIDFQNEETENFKDHIKKIN